MPHLLDQEKFSAGSDRTDGSRDDRAKLEKAAQVVASRAEPLQICERKMDGRLARSDIECGNTKQPFAPNGSAMRRPARCAPDELLAAGIGQ